MIPATFFATDPPSPVLNSLHLTEIQLRGRFPAEHGHDDLQFAPLHIHFFDDAGKIDERSRDDLDLLPYLVLTRGLRLILVGLLQEAPTSLLFQRTRFAPEPTKPVTPGVLRTTYQESSLMIISTST